MYAIIETGGKQYQVREGDVLDVERLSDAKEFSFDKVLLVSDGTASRIGAPYLSQCSVQAEFLEEVKGPKVIAFKYKKCKNYRRTVGHRQKYSRIKIKKITAA